MRPWLPCENRIVGWACVRGENRPAGEQSRIPDPRRHLAPHLRYPDNGLVLVPGPKEFNPTSTIAARTVILT